MDYGNLQYIKGRIIPELLMKQLGHEANRPILLDKMKPTNPNAHTYVNGTDVKTHGYAVTHNTFLQ